MHFSNLGSFYGVMSLELENLIVVRYKDTPDAKRTNEWVPKQKLEHEKHWMCFSKWDRHFVRFCSGKSLDLRAGKPSATVDTQFMDEVFAARQSACNLAAQESLRVSNDEADNGPRRKVARKGFKATAKHATVAPHAIEVTLPQVGSLPPRKAWALFEGDRYRHVLA